MRNGTTKRLRSGGNRREPKVEICKGGDCGRVAVGAGFCLKHYRRWQKYGDPEVVANASPGSRLQHIHDVIAADPDDCEFFADVDGRPATVAYEGKTIRAHRLVLMLTVGPPPEPRLHGCHTCGNGHLGCITPKHLRWDTPKGNAADKVEHGTHIQGEACWKAKVTESDIPTIRLRWDRGETMYQIAADYPVGPKQIWMIGNRKAWKHVPEAA